MAGPSIRLVRGLGPSVEAEAVAPEYAFGVYECQLRPLGWWCCRLGRCVASGLACAFVAIVLVLGQFFLLTGQFSSI